MPLATAVGKPLKVPPSENAEGYQEHGIVQSCSGSAMPAAVSLNHGMEGQVQAGEEPRS